MSDTPKNDGGPAFPLAFSTAEYQTGNTNSGMSLRDVFAGMALQGILASCPDGIRTAELERLPVIPWSRAAYMLADAMLKAREQ